MKTLLTINASGRINRSITRRLTSSYAERWQDANPGGRVVERDVGVHFPRPVDEAWIASAFADPDGRSATAHEVLAESERLIRELEEADEVVLGAPMYNFGLPAQLKAYFDQIIRVNRTFSFGAQADEPYQPLLADKPVTVIISVGDGSLLPGGNMSHLNFLEPHLVTLLGFIGITDIRFVRVGFDEYQDQRHKSSLELAIDMLDRLAAEGQVAHVPDSKAV